MRKIVYRSLAFLFIFALWNIGAVAAQEAGEIKAPTIINADLQNRHACYGRPIVVGLTPKDSAVIIYIDGEAAGEAKINKDSSSVDNFYFQPQYALNPGWHDIRAAARDNKTLKLSTLGSQTSVFVEDVIRPSFIGDNIISGNPRPVIKGAALAGTRTDIYIDGIYNGSTKAISGTGCTVEFSYTPFLNLKQGRHVVYAVSRTYDGKYKSQKSEELIIEIEPPLPAPVLIKAVVNHRTNQSKPFITGVVKSDLKVQVYINNHLDGEVPASNDAEDVSNFAYLPKTKLDGGSYKIDTISVDKRGKESKRSNGIKYYHKKTIAKISDKAAKEVVVIQKETPAVAGVKIETVKNEEDRAASPDIKNDAKNAAATTTVSTTTAATTTAAKGNLSQASSSDEKTGSLNENKEKQSEIKLSLVIFILFLLIVIGWIVWVNRELVKKDESKEKKDEEIK